MKTTAMLLSLVAAVAAQDLTHKAPAQKGAIAIVGGTVHPVSGPPIENGSVLFRNGRITEIGANVAIGRAKVIRVEGRHVYPGFIGAFSNLGLTEIGAVRASRDFDEVGNLTPEVRAAVAVNPDSISVSPSFVCAATNPG